MGSSNERATSVTRLTHYCDLDLAHMIRKARELGRARLQINQDDSTPSLSG